MVGRRIGGKSFSDRRRRPNRNRTYGQAMMLRITILCLVASAVWAQDSTALTGRVVSAADGAPLVNALVVVRTTSMEKTWTGPDGRFRLAGVPTGTYGMLVSKPGFHSEERRLQLAAGGGAQELLFRLTPESVIAGTAVRPDGAPLQGARISLWEQPDRLAAVLLEFLRKDRH